MDGEHRSDLRQPFIATANALATLYKTATSAERDGRDNGARAAYMHVMEWAARKSRRHESISAQEVMAFCSDQLGKVAAASGSREEETSNQQNSGMNSSSPRPAPLSHPTNTAAEGRQRVNHPPVLSIQNSQARDDPLVSDIRKLAVNPRKRPRIDISDTFMRACEDATNDAVFFSAGSIPQDRDRDSRFSDLGEFTSLRGIHDGNNDSEASVPPTRQIQFPSRTTSELGSFRKSRSTRSSTADKRRKK